MLGLKHIQLRLLVKLIFLFPLVRVNLLSGSGVQEVEVLANVLRVEKDFKQETSVVVQEHLQLEQLVT